MLVNGDSLLMVTAPGVGFFFFLIYGSRDYVKK